MAEGLKQSWGASPPPLALTTVICFLLFRMANLSSDTILYLSALTPRNLPYLSTGTGLPGGTEVKNLRTSAGHPGDLGAITG